jgi:ribosome recycling factor
MNDDIVKNFQSALDTVVSSLTQEMGGIRTNTPHPQLVEEISVTYMEQQLPLKQMGTISIQPPRTIQVSAWDIDGAKAIAKAIEDAGRGLTASVDGANVYIKLPELSSERREELSKLAKNIAEQFRIRVRTTREDANKRIEREASTKTISEDDKFSLKKKIQDATDKANKQIEELLERKTKEISE